MNCFLFIILALIRLLESVVWCFYISLKKFSATISSNMPLSQIASPHFLGLSLKACEVFLFSLTSLTLSYRCAITLSPLLHRGQFLQFYFSVLSSAMCNLLVNMFTEFLIWVIVFFSFGSFISFFFKSVTLFIDSCSRGYFQAH